MNIDALGIIGAIDGRRGSNIKRFQDLVIGFLAILTVLPLLVLIAFLIRAFDPGPVLFCQRRVGLGGQMFDMLKFRTMVVDADARLFRHLQVDRSAALEWAGTQKLSDDPRITPLGRFLRTTSLDELPQLWNVLMGDMSLVGPRPIVEAERDRFGNKLELYQSVRPGLTGLWQVTGRSDTSYQTRVNLDVRYVTQWSLTGDWLIMLKTIPVVLKADGAR